MKTCRDCRVEKSVDEFSPNSKNKDGRPSYCRACLRVRHRSYRDARRGGPPVLINARLPVGECTGKWSPGCSDSLPLTAFGKNRSTSDGLTAYCRPGHNVRGAQSRERNGGGRSYHLMRRYGITAVQFDAMVEEQGGVCALCRVASPTTWTTTT